MTGNYYLPIVTPNNMDHTLLKLSLLTSHRLCVLYSKLCDADMSVSNYSSKRMHIAIIITKRKWCIYIITCDKIYLSHKSLINYSTSGGDVQMMAARRVAVSDLVASLRGQSFLCSSGSSSFTGGLGNTQ